MSPRITIDWLGEMVQNGFNEIYKVMATKEDLINLEDRLTFKFERRFDLIEDRLSLIETALKRRKILA